NALRQHPEVNSSFLGAAVRQYHNVNVGIAVAGKGTLLVPVIRACESKSIGQIARERAVLVEKGQAGKLSPEELSGGTFTISNLGMLGITRFTAVINPPQAAILAVGTVRDVPVVKDGQVVPGKRMAVTLSCDHRAFDGAEGARFMATLKMKLENPLAISL
ncbi:MAG TPA: 2-oxo acid dehydrogenase subunit E2, partial [bacterium]|nr:2-oxo acid dehydrogenase subunit E2 [bacterium]